MKAFPPVEKNFPDFPYNLSKMVSLEDKGHSRTAWGEPGVCNKKKKLAEITSLASLSIDESLNP